MKMKIKEIIKFVPKLYNMFMNNLDNVLFIVAIITIVLIWIELMIRLDDPIAMIALCGVLIMIVIIIIKVKHDSKRIDK
jgi:hypothetical protein